MAAKVGSAAVVSYGIGVQNRYSAFLEDDEGLLMTSAQFIKRPNDAQLVASNKQRVALSKSNAGAGKSAGRSDSSSINQAINHKKTESQQKGQATNGHQHKSAAGPSDAKRQHQPHQEQQQQQQQQQQPQQQQRNGRLQNQSGQAARNTQAPRQQASYNRSGENNQDSNGQVTASNSRYSRTQTNGNHSHQYNASHQRHSNSSNKENGDEARPFRNSSNANQRFNKPRQFQQDDRKQQQPDGQLNGHLHQVSEEEKHRRQQRRPIDVKHKDPERREARRSQAANGLNEQQRSVTSTEGNEPNDESIRQRNPRVRSDSGKGKEEPAADQRGTRGVRNRARGVDGAELNGARDGQQASANASRRADRPAPRNRNGFGTGSRNGRNEARSVQEKPKPIPNFSDKSDFPSLASRG